MREMRKPTQGPPAEFATNDLATASFLVTREVPLLRVDWEGSRASFIFPDSARETARLLFVPGQDLVPARRFHQTMRELRGLARGEGGRFR